MRVLFILPLLVVVGCGQNSIAPPGVMPPVIKSETVESMNINVEAEAIGGDGQPIVAQQVGRLIADVAADVRSGTVKPTSETKWAQIHVRLATVDSPRDFSSLGTFRVPLSSLKSADAASEFDNRRFLDLVDYVDRGPEFEAMEAFCRPIPDEGKGQKFCMNIVGNQ
jgi:hypothetical protein